MRFPPRSIQGSLVWFPRGGRYDHGMRLNQHPRRLFLGQEKLDATQAMQEMQAMQAMQAMQKQREQKGLRTL